MFECRLEPVDWWWAPSSAIPGSNRVFTAGPLTMAKSFASSLSSLACKRTLAGSQPTPMICRYGRPKRPNSAGRLTVFGLATGAARSRRDFHYHTQRIREHRGIGSKLRPLRLDRHFLLRGRDRDGHLQNLERLRPPHPGEPPALLLLRAVARTTRTRFLRRRKKGYGSRNLPQRVMPPCSPWSTTNR